MTWGAFRLEIGKDKNGTPDAVVLTPLPEMEGFPVTLRVEKLIGIEKATVAGIKALDWEGKELRDVPPLEGKGLSFRTGSGEFAYRISLRTGG